MLLLRRSVVVIYVLPFRDFSFKMHHFLGVLIHHIGNRNCRNDLEKIWCDAFEETAESFILNGSLGHVPDTSIGWRMKDGPLSL